MSVVDVPRNVRIMVALTMAIASASAQTPAAAQARGKFVRQYCIGCHGERLKTAGIVLQDVDAARVSEDPGVWERVLRQVSSGQMPPAGMPHPDDSARSAFADNLEVALDRAARANPNPLCQPGGSRRSQDETDRRGVLRLRRQRRPPRQT